MAQTVCQQGHVLSVEPTQIHKKESKHMKCRLKRFKHNISVSWRAAGITVVSVFNLGAVPIDDTKALKLARILYPGKRNLTVLLTKEYD